MKRTLHKDPIPEEFGIRLAAGPAPGPAVPKDPIGQTGTVGGPGNGGPGTGRRNTAVVLLCVILAAAVVIGIVCFRGCGGSSGSSASSAEERTIPSQGGTEAAGSVPADETEEDDLTQFLGGDISGFFGTFGLDAEHCANGIMNDDMSAGYNFLPDMSLGSVWLESHENRYRSRGSYRAEDSYEEFVDYMSENYGYDRRDFSASVAGVRIGDDFQKAKEDLADKGYTAEEEGTNSSGQNYFRYSRNGTFVYMTELDGAVSYIYAGTDAWSEFTEPVEPSSPDTVDLEGYIGGSMERLVDRIGHTGTSSGLRKTGEYEFGYWAYGKGYSIYYQASGDEVVEDISMFTEESQSFGGTAVAATIAGIAIGDDFSTAAAGLAADDWVSEHYSEDYLRFTKDGHELSVTASGDDGTVDYIRITITDQPSAEPDSSTVSQSDDGTASQDEDTAAATAAAESAVPAASYDTVLERFDAYLQTGTIDLADLGVSQSEIEDPLSIEYSDDMEMCWTEYDLDGDGSEELLVYVGPSLGSRLGNGDGPDWSAGDFGFLWTMKDGTPALVTHDVYRGFFRPRNDGTYLYYAGAGMDSTYTVYDFSGNQLSQYTLAEMGTLDSPAVYKGEDGEEYTESQLSHLYRSIYWEMDASDWQTAG